VSKITEKKRVAHHTIFKSRIQFHLFLFNSFPQYLVMMVMKLRIPWKNFYIGWINILTGSSGGPSSLLFNGYQGLLSWGQSGRGMKLTTHLHLVSRSRMRGAIPPLPNTPSWRGAQLKHRDNFTFIGSCGVILWMRWWNFRFHKIREFFDQVRSYRRKPSAV
jgi:hypothetical protein